MTYRPDYRDIVGGFLLIALGLWTGLYAMANYELGTVRQMGPGMFPAALGFLLAALGLFIAIPAFFRSGTTVSIDWRPIVFVTIGVLAFALTVTRVGMVPAVVLLTLIVVMADTKLRFFAAVILSAALTSIAYIVFRVGLGIPLEPFRWPF